MVQAARHATYVATVWSDSRVGLDYHGHCNYVIHSMAIAKVRFGLFLWG